MQRRTYRKGVAVGNIVVIVVQQTNKIVLEYGDAIDFFLIRNSNGLHSHMDRRMAGQTFVCMGYIWELEREKGKLLLLLNSTSNIEMMMMTTMTMRTMPMLKSMWMWMQMQVRVFGGG